MKKLKVILFSVLLMYGFTASAQKTTNEEYPTLTGHLRFNAAQLSFHIVKNTEIKTDTLKIYNEWEQTMTMAFTKLPLYITCKAVPGQLKPKSKGYLLISYDAGKRNDFGLLNDRFTFETNDSLIPEKQVGISINITEDFSKMTPEQLANAAMIKFENTNYNFDTVKEGDKVEIDYVFTNIGKSDLIIRKVKGS
jgi:hypothetical protein